MGFAPLECWYSSTKKNVQLFSQQGTDETVVRSMLRIFYRTVVKVERIVDILPRVTKYILEEHLNLNK